MEKSERRLATVAVFGQSGYRAVYVLISHSRCQRTAKGLRICLLVKVDGK